jgi:hypothetical protein
MEIENLVGHTLTTIVDNDNETLLFITPYTRFLMEATQNLDVQSFITDVIGDPCNLLSKIQSAEHTIQCKTPTKLTTSQITDHTFTLKTSLGVCSFVWRTIAKNDAPALIYFSESPAGEERLGSLTVYS